MTATNVLLSFLFAAVVCTISASAQTPPPQGSGKFQPLPKDPALQNLPTANPGTIQFSGNRSYSDAQLQTALATQIKEIQERGLSRPRADDSAYFLSVFYHKNGYSEAEVKYDIRGSHLLLTVHEGPRTYLRAVRFQGNRAYPDKTLFEYVIGGTEERLITKPNSVPFVQADVESGVDRIRGFYQSEGYLDVAVDDPIITFSAGHSEANVLIKLKEGPRYVFGEIRFVGQTLFTPDQLLADLGEPAGGPYTTQHLNTLQHNLEYYYKERGYYTAKVEAAADPKKAGVARGNKRLVPVVFTIVPGPVYRFDGAHVTGLSRLHPSVVTNRFRSLSGKVYTPEAMDQRFRELLHTGLFSDLRINTKPVPGNQVEIDLTGNEAKAKTVGFSVGYGSYDGIIFGLELADRDLFGSGRPLTLDVDYSQREERAELAYFDPWLFESDVSMRDSIFIRQREETGYTKQDQGLRIDFKDKPFKSVELGAYLEVKNVHVISNPIVTSYLGPTSYTIGIVGLTQAFDHRNSPVDPTKGWIVTMAEDGDVVAGSLAFARVTARITEYYPLGHNFLLALGARGGVIFPFTQVPIDERYFNGGPTTVRSFSERNLGPRDPRYYPIGGEVFTVFNAELDFPLRDQLYGAVFTDAGNLLAQESTLGLQHMRYGIGFGLRYRLPVGPVRLDVGFNPDPQRFEHWGAVNFSFGFAF